MPNKLHSITVKGNNHTWGFEAYVDPKYLDEWRADGLEIYEIENTVPMWVPTWIPIRLWCFLQDAWNFKWLRRWL